LRNICGAKEAEGAGTGDAKLKQQGKTDQAIGKPKQQALDRVKMRSAEARAELIRG